MGNSIARYFHGPETYSTIKDWHTLVKHQKSLSFPEDYLLSLEMETVTSIVSPALNTRTE